VITVGIPAVFWTIWKSSNASCFKNKRIGDSFVLIHLVGHWLNSWSTLQPKQANRDELAWVIKLVEQAANENFQASKG
jgi:hypothetical protein